MNKHSFKFFILLSAWAFSIQASNTWIGYQSNDPPRTPGLQGEIDLNFISQYLPNNPIIVEAGASTGTDTERMAIRWPKGFLYSYEPVPRQFDEAIKRCARFDNVFLSNRALGEKKGKALFYISNTKDLQNPDNGPSSLLYPSGLFSTYHPQFDFKETIETDVITLDDVMEEHHLSHIDLLWLDLQGYEPAVLRASPKALKTVHVIFTEVSLIELYSESELYISFKNWLESEGFQVVREDLPYVDAGNVLFIRRRYK